MKECYLTQENIPLFTKELFEKLSSFTDIEKLEKKIKFLPETTALIVIDMQDYFLSEDSHAYIPSSKAIIPGIIDLIKTFVNAKRPVFFTRHLNDENTAGAMGKWWNGIITEEDPLSKINHIFINSPVEDECKKEYDNNYKKDCKKKHEIIEKTQYDAFYNTPLEDKLKSLDIKKIVICGVMTNLCCETTARSAFVRGFDVFFTVDGTAAYNYEYHLSSIINLSHGFAVPVTIEMILKSMSDKK